MLSKITNFVKQYSSEIILAVAIACITLISFNLGRMSALGTIHEAPITLVSPQPSGATAGSGSSGRTATPNPAHTDPRVVASKASSSHLYHFTWCSGAQRITEKNKLYFPTESAAISAGYTLAGNCQK